MCNSLLTTKDIGAVIFPFVGKKSIDSVTCRTNFFLKTTARDFLLLEKE